MKDIYNDKTYLTNNPAWHEEDAPYKAEKITDLLKRNNISPVTIGEAGCGSGEVLVRLGQMLPGVKSFRGYDVSADAIAIAKGKETAKIKFMLSDISASEETIFFDLLLIIDVIEHIDNYFKFLKGIAFRSRYTVFHIPLDMALWTLFREKMLIESKERVGHIHNFTEDFLVSILQDYGFIIIDRMYTAPINRSRSFKQKMIGVLRRLLFRINKRFCTKTIGGYSLLVLAKNDPSSNRDA